MASLNISPPNTPFKGTELVLPAPAKLNLFLHVCGQRSDGYHNLQTVFQFLDYSDELRFRCRNDGVIQLHTPMPDIPDSDNLVVKAARALQRESNTTLGADMWISKCLPMGGGIGGGSSNAATTLVALNLLWQCLLSRQDLQRIGLQLGADVPVFIYGQSAWAEGVGEQLQALDLAEPWYVVAVPPCHVSTAEIFSAKELTRGTQAITIAAFLEQGGRNDCEALVKKRYPAVKNALDWLDQFAEARMTGTGACVFAQFDTRTEAQEVLSGIPDSLQGFVARGANQSPLYQALARLRTQ